jgi:microcystin degradation protein MlrC
MILKSAREIVGNDVVIGVAMDLHANITQLKIENVDILRGYHTHPM